MSTRSELPSQNFESQVPTLEEGPRWLNPFASQRTAMWTPLKPDEIEAALRPLMFNYRRSYIPHEGVYGVLKSWGFVIWSHMLQSTRLDVRYEKHPGGTVLNMRVRRSVAGLFLWALNMVGWPVAATSWIYSLHASGFFSSILSLSFDNLWISGQRFPMQPALYLVMIPFALHSTLKFITNCYQRSDEIDYYRTLLSYIIDARSK
jgi:hypothetical protein